MSGPIELTTISRSPSATLLPILAIIAGFVCLPILVMHIKSHNLAASVLVFWIVLENVFNFINPLIWPTADESSWWLGYGLCDVEVKLELAASLAYIGAVVCIYRRLARVLDTSRIVLVASPAQRWRHIALEIVLCFGLPIYIMVAHYIVQPSRYYLVPVEGCLPSFSNCWPSIVLVYIWPVVLWIVAAIYCTMIAHRLVKCRREFSDILSASQSQLNKSRFIRLFALATTLSLIFLPLAVDLFVGNIHISVENERFGGISFSWETIHRPGWTDDIALVRSDDTAYGTVNFDHWLQVTTGYVVFLSFGFGQDALLMYRDLWTKLGSLRVLFTRFRSARRASAGANGPLPRPSGEHSFGTELQSPRRPTESSAAK